MHGYLSHTQREPLGEPTPCGHPWWPCGVQDREPRAAPCPRHSRVRGLRPARALATAASAGSAWPPHNTTHTPGITPRTFSGP